MTAATAAERVLVALREQGRKVIVSGQGATAQCPSHEDRNPSLSIRDGNGKALIYCHAGCHPADVMAALGLNLADLFNEQTHEGKPPLILATYDYVDEHGQLLYQTVRMVPKTFRQRRPEPGGGWEWSLGDVRRVLYRLPEVAAAVRAVTTVYVTEGEKDADALAARGHVATCNPMGAGKWRPEYGNLLKGADVVIVADNDKAGIEHAHQVAADLDGKAATVRTGTVDPGIGNDLSDHLRAGRDVADLPGLDSIATGTALPDPIPLKARFLRLPDFPVDKLPAWAAQMVSQTAEFTQTDPGMAGTVVLSVLSAAAGGRVEVEARPGWREPVNLYTVTVAGPGERKSAVQAVLTAPLMAAEDTLVDLGRAAVIEAETTKEIAKRAADKARADASRADAATRDNLTAEALTAAMHAEAIVVPALPRILADDVTPEAAASLLAEQGGRLAIVSAEGGVFDIIAGRYSSNIPNLDVFLKAHAGDPLRIDRKGRPPEQIKRPALTLGLMIQPAVLVAIARNESFRGRGLLARFLYALPTSMVGHRKIGAAPVHPDTRAVYEQTVRTVTQTLAGWTDPAVLVLTPEAAEVLLDYERASEPRLGPQGDLRHFADWGSKLIGATLRIAGLLHLADHPTDGWRRGSIEVGVLRRAVYLADYYVSHAMVAFDRMAADPVLEDAVYLLELLARLGQDVVTRRDLFTAASRSRFRKAADLEPVIGLLVEHGHLVVLPDPVRSGPGRRPSPTYLVHPHVLAAETAETAEPQPEPDSADSAVSAAATEAGTEWDSDELNLGPCVRCQQLTIRYGAHGNPLCADCRAKR